MPRPEGPARAPNPGTPGWAVDFESGKSRSGPGNAQAPSGKVLETPRKQARAGLFKFPALEDTLHAQEVPELVGPGRRPPLPGSHAPWALRLCTSHAALAGQDLPFRSCNLNPEAPSFLEVDIRLSCKAE